MKFLIFILIFVGMFMISGSLLKLPPYSTSQRLRSISGKAGMTEMLKQRLLLPVIKIVALIVHLDDFPIKAAADAYCSKHPFNPQLHFSPSKLIGKCPISPALPLPS